MAKHKGELKYVSPTGQNCKVYCITSLVVSDTPLTQQQYILTTMKQ